MLVYSKVDVTSYGRPAHVKTDHKPHESIFMKNLISAPKRLQRVLLRLQRFDLSVTYTKGSEMALADTFTRALDERVETTADDVEEALCVDDLRGQTEKNVEEIIMIRYVPVTEEIKAEIQTATEADDAESSKPPLEKDGHQQRKIF